MASKQLIETESKREFYPNIELASNTTDSTSLPATWGLVQTYTHDNYINNNRSTAQTIVSPVIITSSEGLATAKIKANPEDESDTLLLDATAVNIGGDIIVESTSISSSSDQNNSEITFGSSLDLDGEDINIDAEDQIAISGNGGISINDNSEIDIKAPATLIANFVNINSAGNPVAKGSNNKFIYINSSGQFAESSLSAGSSTKPVYISSGAITESNATLGSNNKFIYMNSGVFTESNASVGNSTTLMYLDNGKFRAGTTFNITDVSVPN